MPDFSLAEQFRRQRGKPLDNQQVVYLWKLLMHDSHGKPTLRLLRRRAVHAEAEAHYRHGERDSQPKQLKDWVKLNRTMRGAVIPPSKRHKLLAADIDELLKPRCGHWQYSPDRLPKIPGRLRRRFEWAEQSEHGWDKQSIAVFVDAASNLPLGITANQFKLAMERAAGTWNSANVGIRITFAASRSHADVVASWSSESTDAHGVLGESVMAHADFPAPNTKYVAAPPLPMCFNRLHLWSSNIDSGPEEPTRYDIESMALHELGHCIGLFHRERGSVMYEIVGKGRHRVLDNGTIQAARQLYSENI